MMLLKERSQVPTSSAGNINEENITQSTETHQ